MYQIIANEYGIYSPQTEWETEKIALEVAMHLEVSLYRELGLDVQTGVMEIK